MSATEPASNQTCANCAQGTGAARAITIEDGQRTVTYVCDRCEHQWDITTDDRPVSLRATSPMLRP
jgi:DNA-directed RNA polymerase subunit M/transcription elongation factor TFIIS